MNCTRRSFLKGSLATIFFSNFNVPLYGSIKNPKKILLSSVFEEEWMD